jgi:2,5-diamino-6-(ribosylamino)-4(3H)-pyrimidinone 5'-phosphate reductase
MLPKVVLHNSISLDGRNQGFMPDMGLHYELVMGMVYKFDIHLTGSGTILAQEGQIKPEPNGNFEKPEPDLEDKRPILVIPDSRGQVRSWYMLRKEPYWRECVALCTKNTPKSFLEYLEKRYIEYILAGSDHVNFHQAFEELNKRYGAKTILLDSGGALNGVLLREGLVSEISLLVHPLVVGGAGYKSFVMLPEREMLDKNVQIELMNMEKKKDNLLWLRYGIKY